MSSLHITDSDADSTSFWNGVSTGDEGYLGTLRRLPLHHWEKKRLLIAAARRFPAEIEEVLLDHVAVQDAIVFSLPHPKLGKKLAVVLRAGASWASQSYRSLSAAVWLISRYPILVVFLAELPMTPGGKRQRIGLAERLGLTTDEFGSPVATAQSGKPAEAVEEIVSGIWATVLGRKQVRPGDDFFHIGGDSILATQILARIRQAFGIDLSFVAFFQTPTVAGIARLVQASCVPTPAQTLTVQPAPSRGDAPLTFAQEGIWFLSQLAPGNAAYNVYRTLLIQGPLEHVNFKRSLQEIIDRHDICARPSGHGRSPVE